jgi:hypothetical protein
MAIILIVTMGVRVTLTAVNMEMQVDGRIGGRRVVTDVVRKRSLVDDRVHQFARLLSARS